jgi:hypothetical protein
MMKQYIVYGGRGGMLYTMIAKCVLCDGNAMRKHASYRDLVAMQIGDGLSTMDDGGQEYGHKLRAQKMMSKVEQDCDEANYNRM